MSEGSGGHPIEVGLNLIPSVLAIVSFGPNDISGTPE